VNECGCLGLGENEREENNENHDSPDTHLHLLHWDLTLEIPTELSESLKQVNVRADLGGHLKYSQRWSGVRAGVLLGAQGTVRRGENRGGL